MQQHKLNSGFTLVEMVITLTVIAILAGIAVPSFTETLDRRRVSGAAEQLRGKIEKNDFQLDAKKEAKKIAQARKILCAAIDDRIKDSKVIDKAVGELTKHLSQLAKYRS